MGIRHKKKTSPPPSAGNRLPVFSHRKPQCLTPISLLVKQSSGDSTCAHHHNPAGTAEDLMKVAGGKQNRHTLR
ncbi:hypothetical protein Q2361_24535, partial [Escherichia coli]|nr:hypothetical protein [Escherichia coli]